MTVFVGSFLANCYLSLNLLVDCLFFATFIRVGKVNYECASLVSITDIIYLNITYIFSFQITIK